MKSLRRLLFISTLLFLASPLLAQYALGGGLSYNVDVKRTGIFLRGTYAPDTLWRAAGTFNYFLDNTTRATRWELSFDIHHFFWSNQRVRSYLVGGLNFFHAHFSDATREIPASDPARDNHFGINLGAGLETSLNESIFPFAEMKVSVGDGSLFGIFAGFTYRFRNKAPGKPAAD